MPHECTNCGRTFPDGSKEMLSGCPDCGGNKFQFSPASQSGGGTTATADRTAESAPSSAREHDSRAGRSSAATEATRSRTETTPSDDEFDGFAEWPETARRPADRSTPEAGGAADDAPPAPDRTDSSPRADPSPRADTSEAETTPTDSSPRADPTGIENPTEEDTAQASARSDVVSSDDLPPSTPPAADDSTAGANATAANADGPDPKPEHGRVVSEPSDDRPSLEQLREELNDQFESIKIVKPGQYELNLMELYDREEYIVSLQEDGRYVIDVPDSWRSDPDE